MSWFNIFKFNETPDNEAPNNASSQVTATMEEEEDDDNNQKPRAGKRARLEEDEMEESNEPTLPANYCGICLKSLETNVGTLFDCGHCFHAPCFQQWEELEPNDLILCPICETKKKEFRPVIIYNEESKERKIKPASSYGHILENHVQVLQRSNDPKTVQTALGELVELAFSQHRCKIPIVIQGGVPAILRCMRVFRSSQPIQNYSCQLLGNLVQEESKTERIERAIIKQGATHAILKTMSDFHDDKDIQEQGCYSIGKITCDDVDMKTIQRQLDAVHRAMQHKDAVLLQTYACYALSNFATRANEVGEIIEKIVEINLADILDAMKVHRNDEDLTDAACNVLLSIVQQPNLAKYKPGTKFLQPVVDAMETHISQEVQLYGIAILLQYVSVMGTSDLEAAEGAADCLLQAMDEFSEIIDVQRGVVQIFTAMSKAFLRTHKDEIIRNLEFSLEMYTSEQEYAREIRYLLSRINS